MVSERDRLTLEIQGVNQTIASYEKSIAEDRAFFAPSQTPKEQMAFRVSEKIFENAF